MKNTERKVVYIASPFTGNTTANIQYARDACLYAILLGFTPIAPHLIYPSILPERESNWRQLELELSCDLLARSDEIWVCGPEISEGMKYKQERAKDLGLWVRWVSKEEIMAGIKDMCHAASSNRQRKENF